MITQQSFMFISSYEALRTKLRGTGAAETIIHVGPKAFETISGAKVNTALFVLRREEERALRERSPVRCFRLVKEPSADTKRLRFEAALKRLRGATLTPWFIGIAKATSMPSPAPHGCTGSRPVFAGYFRPCLS